MFVCFHILRGSSCPLHPAVCGFEDLRSKHGNPNILYGAIVGGPREDDQFVDDRMNYR